MKYFSSKTSEAAVANCSGAMEEDTIFVNGRNPKSQMSRRNYKNVRKLLFVVGVATFIFSLNCCRMLTSASLHPQMKNEKLLPPLTPEFIDESFYFRFPVDVTNKVQGAKGLVETTQKNPDISNFKLIFQRDVEKNICAVNLLDVPNGRIECRLIDAYGKVKIIWLLPSMLSAFTLNLLGMPAHGRYDEMQLEVTIFDTENKLVGKYTSDARKRKSFMALYWGWGLEAMTDRNKRVIFTECMEDIKRQIENDYQRLSAALK